MSQPINPELVAWVKKDPSPLRLALAARRYNWDEGMEFLHWLFETYDIDKAALLEIAYIAEPKDFSGLNTSEEVVEKRGEIWLEGWHFLELLEREWLKGKFRSQRTGAFPEVRRNLLARMNPVPADVMGCPRFTFLQEFESLRSDLPMWTYSDLEDEDLLEMNEIFF